MRPATTPRADGVRALFVHAHPDDETITTGGTIAALTGAGSKVEVITSTLGEEGEVLGETWAGLVADRADQLGGYRVMELTGALRALGVDQTRFLGGAGRWRDSGMAGATSAEHPRAFVRSGDEAVDDLAAEIDRFRPDLLVTYAADGGYGHPDHIRVHAIVWSALDRIDHQPRRLAWTVSAQSEVTFHHPNPPSHLRHPDPEELPSVPDSRLTHRVSLDEITYAAKLEALASHSTQLELVPGTDGEPWFLALTNGVLQPIPLDEWYIALDLDTVTGEYVPCVPGVAHLLDGLAEEQV